jgi:hypothetical protein
VALLKQFALGAVVGTAVAGSAAVVERASRSNTEVTPSSAPAPRPSALSVRSARPPGPVPPTTSARPTGGEVSSAGSSDDSAEARVKQRSLETADHVSSSSSAPSARGVFSAGTGQASFAAEAGSANSESQRVLAARALLRRGQPKQALEALASLAAAFPNGALLQEREALAIDATLALGDRDSARRRAASFLARYPESPYASSVRRALK